MTGTIRSVSAAIKLQKLVADNEELAAEMVLANRELAAANAVLVSELAAVGKRVNSQDEEMGKRAAELVIANQELASESEDKGDRAAELALAHERLAAQSEEMGKRAVELAIANREKIELLSQLLQSQKLESLGTLAGGVAHDMNNVLGAILGLATAHMEINTVGTPTYRAFDTIHRAAVRGGKMVRSLLNFARKHPAAEVELDMNEVIQEEVRLLEHTTLAKVRLVLDLAPDLRPIFGDANALAHAFMNLCVNAVDAISENGTLTLRTHNEGDAWIEVSVEDTGSGMSKEVLERALDPFFTTKAEGKGTGLGLSMAHSTVLAHRGQMDIESEPGQGTLMTMRFPVCEPIVQLLRPMTENRPEASLPSLSLLLVDDDELIQSSTQALLELLGHIVTGVLSGEEALAKIEAGYRPDSVILDLNMPGLSGLETLHCLRVLCPALPILVSTGKINQAALDVVAADPHCTLLNKPYSVKDLKSHLEAIGRD